MQIVTERFTCTAPAVEMLLFCIAIRAADIVPGAVLAGALFPFIYSFSSAAAATVASPSSKNGAVMGVRRGPPWSGRTDLPPSRPPRPRPFAAADRYRTRPKCLRPAKSNDTVLSDASDAAATAGADSIDFAYFL